MIEKLGSAKFVFFRVSCNSNAILCFNRNGTLWTSYEQCM